MFTSMTSDVPVGLSPTQQGGALHVHEDVPARAPIRFAGTAPWPFGIDKPGTQ